MLLLFATGRMHAQHEMTDTIVGSDAALQTAVDGSTHFRARQLIAPLTLAAVGATGFIEGSPLHWLSAKTQEEVAKHSYHTGVDEWMQYVPVAVHLGLGFTGVKSKHRFVDRALAASTAYICMTGLTNGLKYTIREKRPDSSARNSFPSGHTATAFTGAELVRIEYGNGIGAAAYGVATVVGALRVYNNRHWVRDVVAGAGIGIISAKVGYWMLPVWKNLFNIKDRDAAVNMAPAIDPMANQYMMNVCVAF